MFNMIKVIKTPIRRNVYYYTKFINIIEYTSDYSSPTIILRII